MGGVKIKAPKAPNAERVGCGEGLSSSPLGERSEEGACPSPEIFCIFASKSHVCDSL